MLKIARLRKEADFSNNRSRLVFMTLATVVIFLVMFLAGAILSPLAILFFSVFSLLDFLFSLMMEKCGFKQ